MEFGMTQKHSIRPFSGQVIKLGDDIDTDLIYPGQYVPLADPEQWALHALEGVDPKYPEAIIPGQIIVAGRNFGCGSSRSQAVSCLKLAGIAAVVAASFARIFFRNSINQGFLVVECPQASQAVQDGETLELDFAAGRLSAPAGEFSFKPLPEHLMAIIAAGGLVPYTKKLLHEKRA